jgi:hypothetical protein
MKKLILFALIQVAQTQAADIKWWKLEAFLSYKDLSVICTTGMFGRSLYLSAELSSKTVKRAVLRNGTEKFSQQIELSPAEVASLEIVEGGSDTLWVKKMPLSGKTMAWILMNLDNSGGMGCHPAAAVTAITPNATWEFDTSAITSLPATSVSAVVKMNGTLKDTSGFVAEIYFSQRPTP